jgi:hypothetical protein
MKKKTHLIFRASEGAVWWVLAAPALHRPPSWALPGIVVVVVVVAVFPAVVFVVLVGVSPVVTMTWPLAPVIPPASSGSQWQGRVLGHRRSFARLAARRCCLLA